LFFVSRLQQPVQAAGEPEPPKLVQVAQKNRFSYLKRLPNNPSKVEIHQGFVLLPFSMSLHAA
jgi:hypothetical protein